MAQAIRDKARALGFDIVRFTDAEATPEAAARLLRFLALNRHGAMDWMERRSEQRADPKMLWPCARSIIMLAMNYGPEKDPLEALKKSDNGVISVYAQNKDYHDVIKKKLKALARWLIAETECELKVFVDTAPVMEKPLAQKAGAGWQGKHTNLVSREFGSWLFLGSIFTTLELPADESTQDHCGACTSCLDICPTNAFPAPYQLDARRCISYLTIEHKGPIPHEFRAAMGNRIYGCDDCLAVCPWNKFAVSAKETAFHPRAALEAPLLKELALLDDAEFRSLFSRSPVKRIGRTRFIRNVAIAIGNTNNPDMSSTVMALLSDDDPVIRGACVWALSRLISEDVFKNVNSAHAAKEQCADVQAEWRMADASYASTVT